jgi:hypothetical protein
MILNFNTRIELTNVLPKSGSIKEQRAIFSLNKKLINPEYLESIDAKQIDEGYTYNASKDVMEIEFTADEVEVLKSTFELLDEQKKFPFILVPLLDEIGIEL